MQEMLAFIIHVFYVHVLFFGLKFIPQLLIIASTIVYEKSNRSRKTNWIIRKQFI